MGRRKCKSRMMERKKKDDEGNDLQKEIVGTNNFRIHRISWAKSDTVREGTTPVLAPFCAGASL